MSRYQPCPRCKKLRFSDGHECPPMWQVQAPWHTEDEFESIFACGAEEAAVDFAQIYDRNNNYPLADYGKEIEVVVTSEDGDVFEFCVFIDPEPVYTAWQIRRGN